MCKVSLGKHNLSTKSEKHLFQRVVSDAVYFLSSSGKVLWSMQKSSFPAPNMWLWLVVGLILSLSVLIIAGLSGEWVFHLPSVSRGWSSWTETAQQRQTQSSAQWKQQDLQQCRTVQGSVGGLLTTVWAFFLVKSSQHQEHGDSSAPLLSKSPLLHIDPPLSQDAASSKCPWYSISASCVLFLPPPLFPAFPVTPWGLFCSGFAVESCFLSCWRTAAQWKRNTGETGSGAGNLQKTCEQPKASSLWGSLSMVYAPAGF